MAQQTLNATAGGPDDNLPTATAKLNSMFDELYALQSRTLNAADPRFAGAIDEASIDNMINLPTIGGIAIGAERGLIPASMLPFNAALVRSSPLVKQIREGGNPDVYDIRAYGAAGNGNTTTDTDGILAAIAAIPANGGVLHIPSGPTGQYQIAAELVLPNDRLITIRGDGAFATNQGGLRSFGSTLRRAAGYTGPLMSQAGSAGTSIFGVQMSGIGFDGNNLAGDLLKLTDTAQVRLDDVTFFNGNGNGLYTENLQNSSLARCRFYELGNNTAFPNGKSALVLNSAGVSGCNTVLLSDCQWESGRGSYLTTNNPGGAAPVALVSIIGGKMEFSGNSQVGFPPSPAPGIPFCFLNAITQWTVKGILTTGGYHTAATHWYLQNAAESTFDLFCSTAVGLADAQNPRFFVDLFSGPGGINVRGTFINGASVSAGTGAQIRVVESSMPGYTISPDCQFITPISGIGISYTNPTTGKASAHRFAGSIRSKTFAVNPALATQPINAADGDVQEFNIATNITVAFQAPSQTPATGQSQDLTITYFNGSGGALTNPPTFATGAGGFLLNGAAPNPGNGLGVSIMFRWSPLAVGGARYREVSRTAAF